MRGNPRFEIEERHHKLELARSLRLVLEEAREGGQWLSLLDAILLHNFQHSFSPLPRQRDWLRDWASVDHESLARVISGFLDPALSISQRFNQFAEAAVRTDLDQNRGSVLSFGSLFNFAQAPSQLPIVHAGLFERLEEILGHDPPSGPRPVEQYEHHLGFAQLMQETIDAEGVPVRDMLDAQGLIFTTSRDHDAWIADAPAAAEEGHAPPARRRAPERSERSAYLSICAIYHDEANYLQEWIEFHRLVGVERFFLYDHDSADAHTEVLRPYIDDGTVVLHDWPMVPGQVEAYEHCIATHASESRWIAVIDLDEYLFSPPGLPLPDLLSSYEQWPAVGVNRALFGTSGHRTRPAGLVIENYVSSIYPDRHIKSIIDPRRALKCISPHHFLCDGGSTVDENRYPIKGPSTTYPSVNWLRINHYHAKSTDELRIKYEKPRADTGAFRADPDFQLMADRQRIRHAHPDDAILGYVPELRKALAR